MIGFLVSLSLRHSGAPFAGRPGGGPSSQGRGRGGAGAAGFSLLELLIVVAIVAIAATVAIPQFQRYRANADLKTAGRAVAADLAAGKQAAVTENRDVYRLTFDVAGNSYALTRTDTGTTLWTKSPSVHGPGIVLTAANFSGGAVVTFNRRGTMSLGSVTLQNALGSTAVVTVNITGRSYVTFDMQ